MKLTFKEDGLLFCDQDNCGSCRVQEHSIHDLLPGDMLIDEESFVLCIGCGHANQAGGTHEFCRPYVVARLATRFGLIDGEHHKQWLIDQMLRVCLENNYDNWVKKMNSDPEDDPWDIGIAP